MSEPRRLHPVAAFLSFLKQLRELIFPILLFFFVGNGDDDGIPAYLRFVLFAVILIVLLVLGVLNWWRFTYRFEENELRIEYGVFVRKKRYIPKDRIQTIDTQAGIIPRLFGLVKLQVETAGGGEKAEAVLTAITVQEAERLRGILLAESPNETEEWTEDVSPPIWNQGPIYQISTRELIIAASTSGGIGVVLSAIGALMSQLDEIIPLEKILPNIEELKGISLMFLVVTGLFVLVTAWVLSIFGVVLRYGKFRVVKKGEDLIISSGILEKRQITIPLQRIQAIRVTESLLRQPFGYATVYLESAGGTLGKEGVTGTILFPVVKKRELVEQVQMFIPQFTLPAKTVSLPKVARRRYLFRAIVLPFLLLLVAAIFFWPWGMVSFILIPMAGWLGHLRYQDAGYYIEEKRLWLSYRLFSKSIVLVEKRRIQSFALRQSIFQRKKQLLSIETWIKAGVGSRYYAVVDVAEESGEQVKAWFLEKKESDQ